MPSPIPSSVPLRIISVLNNLNIFAKHDQKHYNTWLLKFMSQNYLQIFYDYFKDEIIKIRSIEN